MHVVLVESGMYPQSLIPCNQVGRPYIAVIVHSIRKGTSDHYFLLDLASWLLACVSIQCIMCSY